MPFLRVIDQAGNNTEYETNYLPRIGERIMLEYGINNDPVTEMGAGHIGATRLLPDQTAIGVAEGPSGQEFKENMVGFGNINGHRDFHRWYMSNANSASSQPGFHAGRLKPV
jgi:hypothetical protein